MKRIAAITLACMTAFVGAVNAAPISFQGFLTGAKESPSNASPGTGTALVTIDLVAHTLEVSVTFKDLTGPNTAAHIHVINGPGDANTADTNGPVVTATPTFLGFPSGTTFGTFHDTLDTTLASTYRAGFVMSAGGLAPAEAALFSGIMEGRAYLNIHTGNYPGGEIRSFLTPVPEPVSLMLLGSGVAGYFVRRRRGRV